jgi:hypothetical protein
MKPLHTLFAVVVAATLFAPARASADCASGPTYAATVQANTVSLFIDGDWSGNANTLLRQNEADGTVVAFATPAGVGNFYDQCVPAGTYRYGYQTPFDCSEHGCSPDIPYFTEATVTTPLPATCTRDANVAAPAQTSTVPPWDSNGTITQNKSCPNGGCSFHGHTRSGVRVMILAMLGAGLVLLGRRVRRAKAR